MFDATTPTEIDLLNSAARGMNVQRTLLDLAARNVAAAQASTPNHPYTRLVAQFASAPESADGEAWDAETDANAMTTASGNDDTQTPAISVRAQSGSGDALAEMISVLDAQRAYEQNASVFDIGKRLAERTIDIGRS